MHKVELKDDPVSSMQRLIIRKGAARVNSVFNWTLSSLKRKPLWDYRDPRGVDQKKKFSFVAVR